MSMTNIISEDIPIIKEKPGAQLAAQRVLRDYSQEYVAGKLHLRVRIIELLEADDYENMPEPVFIKGYLRAYAKLLGVQPDPLLAAFNVLYSDEKKNERTLWQSSRQSNKAEYIVRWATILMSLGVLVAVGMWWESSRENDPILPGQLSQQSAAQPNTPDHVAQKTVAQAATGADKSAQPSASQTTLAEQQSLPAADLSKMQALLSPVFPKDVPSLLQKKSLAGDE